MHIDLQSAVGSKTILNCLRLCGYNHPSDFNNFDASSVENIEKFVIQTCRAMPRERRSKYIEPVFIDCPELFGFQPAVKMKLLAYVSQTLAMGGIMELQGHQNPFNTMEYVDTYVNDLQICNTPVVEDVCQELTIEEIVEDDSFQKVSVVVDKMEMKRELLPVDQVNWNNYTISSKANHRILANQAAIKFRNCNLEMDEDFQLMVNNNDPSDGFFLCKLEAKSDKHKDRMRVMFNKDGRAHFSAIHNHLRGHFHLRNQKDHNGHTRSDHDNSNGKSGHRRSDYLHTTKKSNKRRRT